MLIIAGLAWILFWGLVGYITVKAILVGDEIWRYQRTGTKWFEQQKTLEKQKIDATKSKDIVYNPFEGLL